VQDADSLAQAFIRFLDLPNEQQVAMGKAGRNKMKSEFDQSIVTGAYLDALQRLTHRERE
jgi:glycosyltransferase involved in cell wall biosynthesis